ncbi:MAG: RIP metalloprotease RseP [Cypionkella sp.]|nr:RIP metalloprotease RseP [Cypionkella sp.]
MTAFLGEMAGLGWTLVSFILALGVIIAVHEYGHYIVGRWTGIKADVFSLGFGPVIASRMDRRGTRWQVAAIPLGGFVRFKGDADAASARQSDVSALPAAEARSTMAGAPLWARALTVAAGPAFNFALSFVIFMAVILASGMAADRPIVGAVYPMPQVYDLREGDAIVAINGVPTPDSATFYQTADSIGPVPDVTYSVQRDGQVLDIVAGHPFPARAASVHLQSAAFAAGIREGDVVMSIDGQPISAFSQLPIAVEASQGAALNLIVWRQGQGEMALTLSPNRRDIPTADGGFETRWMMGLSSGLLFEAQRRSAGPVEAAQIAARQVWAVVSGTFSGIAYMLRGEISTCNLSGPVGLASTMGQAASTGFESFVTMLAMVSLGVGILNLLPIPVLDGGHLVFYAYEAITRRKPNPRILNLAVMVGLFLVLSLTIFAIGNDLTCS